MQNRDSADLPLVAAARERDAAARAALANAPPEREKPRTIRFTARRSRIRWNPLDPEPGAELADELKDSARPKNFATELYRAEFLAGKHRRQR